MEVLENLENDMNIYEDQDYNLSKYKKTSSLTQ